MKTSPVIGSLAGRFKMEAIKLDGTRRLVADWFDNLILDQGLNRLGTGPVISYVHVGSGATAPVAANTAMQTFVAATNTQTTGAVDGTQPTPPYYGWRRWVFRFPAGAAAGNLSEVGVGWATGANLFSRALILDGVGVPTTKTVLSDEYLDVTYELRLYPPTVDQTFQLTIGGIVYDFTLRAANVTSNNWHVNTLASTFGVDNNGAFSMNPYPGPIGTITQLPSGSAAAGGSLILNAYSNNSLKRTGKFTFGLTAGNVPGGIGAFSLTSPIGAFQVGVTPVIPKDATKVFTMDVEYTWARKTI